jgi:putative tricarboxylic transport membrane protein
VLWIVGGLLAQMILLKPVGFSIGTGLLFAATARGFGRGPLWKTIPIGIVLSLAIWVLFAKGLQLSLPAGPIERLI